MDIIFQGSHECEDAGACVQSVLRLLNERYHIESFREIHLTLTLVDGMGEDVELVDSETNQAFRVLEICRDTPDVSRRVGRPALKLVVDNAKGGN